MVGRPERLERHGDDVDGHRLPAGQDAPSTRSALREALGADQAVAGRGSSRGGGGEGGGRGATQKKESVDAEVTAYMRMPAESPSRVREIILIIAAAVLALILGAFAAPWSNAPAALPCSPDSFRSALPAGASILSTVHVPEGGSYGEGAADVAYPTNPAGLPEVCAVIVNVTTSASSSYRFGLFLPTAAHWNNKILTVGNGGFAGGINWLDMGAGAHYGFVAVSSDLGHNSTAPDLTWALHQPEKRTDWGWRALHGSVALGKALTSAYYGTPVKYSYYSGCSTGGRQGLKEIQISPESFDGALIGSPSWYVSHLNNYVTQVGSYNLPATDPKHIDYTLFPNVADEVVRQCDALDGLADGIISSPELCKVDLNKLRCGQPGVNASACFSCAQLRTVKNVYSDWTAADGTFLYTGYTPGSEDQWWTVLAGTEPSPYGVGYQRYFLYDDANWDWHAFNDSAVALADRTDPGQPTAAQYDISAFKARGGKVVLYHGLADGLVPSRGSDLYYNRTVAAFGGSLADTTDFFRYFQIPGMQHCWATPNDAPWNIAGAFQAGSLGNATWSVPGFQDAEHDALLALVDWVEKGKAVDSIVATTWKSSMVPSSGVLRQRPLCPWPQKAKWNGKGNVNAASSWSCH